jgi:hypothetical protein
MVNPFDLRGPEFLVFYFVLGVAVTAAVLALRHRGEPPGLSAGPLTDYLKIAYLGGGSAEAIRVASVALMARGRWRGCFANRNGRDRRAPAARRPARRADPRVAAAGAAAAA